jgi:uncharacterized protein
MTLSLRPNCECCDKDLPPDSTEAMICTFECTFCRTCVDQVLADVCPNCGGGFRPRPVRPKTNWRGDNDLEHYPPSTAQRHRPVDPDDHRRFIELVGAVPPDER